MLAQKPLSNQFPFLDQPVEGFTYKLFLPVYIIESILLEDEQTSINPRPATRLHRSRPEVRWLTNENYLNPARLRTSINDHRMYET
jgi:hypothetical protein